MKSGPPPKPTALKKLAGNPGKKKLKTDEPKFAAPLDLLKPPKWLDKVAADEWRRVAPHLLPLGLLTVVDSPTLEAYCKAYSRWRQAEKTLGNTKSLVFKTGTGYSAQRPEVAIALRYMSQLHALAAEFGFTPASRTRVAAQPKEAEKDPMEEFLKGGGTPLGGPHLTS